jgi:hypothetical protein
MNKRCVEVCGVVGGGGEEEEEEEALEERRRKGEIKELNERNKAMMKAK